MSVTYHPTGPESAALWWSRPPTRLFGRPPRHRGLRVIAAVAMVTVVAVGCVTLLPHGPAATAQAVGSVVVGLVTGVLVALLAPTRAMVPVAPLVFVSASEAARPGVEGPVTGLVALDSTLGVLTSVSGGGLFVLLLLLPLALGVELGIAAMSRSGLPGGRARAPSPPSTQERIGTSLALLLLIVLVAGLIATDGYDQAPLIRDADVTASADP